MRRWLLVVVVMFMVLPHTAVAQCKIGDPVVKCLREGVKDSHEQVTGIEAVKGTQTVNEMAALEAATVATTSQQISLQNTGVQGLGLAQNASTGDFANNLIALLEAVGAGTRTGDTVTVGIGFPVSAAAGKKKLKLTAALTDPKLDSAVSSKLTGKDLEDAKNSIDKSARDVTFAAAWAFKHRSLPNFLTTSSSPLQPSTFRSDQAFSPSLSGPIVRAIVVTSLNADGIHATDIVTESNQEAIKRSVGGGIVPALNKKTMLNPSSIERLVDSYARLLAAAADEQTQFWGEARYHYRDPLIGTKETKVSLTYEFGAAGTATTTLKDLVQSSQDVEGFVATADQGATPSSKPSLTIKGDYSQVQRRKFDLPVLASLIKPSRHVVSVSAVAGWKLAAVSDERVAKVDFNGTYENDSGDPKKKNRLIASLMFTQKLSEKVSIPLTFVYASHSSDLDVNRRFSAHFGISYKLPTVDAAAKKEAMRAALTAGQ